MSLLAVRFQSFGDVPQGHLGTTPLPTQTLVCCILVLVPCDPSEFSSFALWVGGWPEVLLSLTKPPIPKQHQKPPSQTSQEMRETIHQTTKPPNHQTPTNLSDAEGTAEGKTSFWFLFWSKARTNPWTTPLRISGTSMAGGRAKPSETATARFESQAPGFSMFGGPHQ